MKSAMQTGLIGWLLIVLASSLLVDVSLGSPGPTRQGPLAVTVAQAQAQASSAYHSTLLKRCSSSSYSAGALIQELNNKRGFAEVAAFMKYIDADASSSIDLQVRRDIQASFADYLAKSMKVTSNTITGNRMPGAFVSYDKASSASSSATAMKGRSMVVRMAAASSSRRDDLSMAPWDVPIVVSKVYNDEKRFDKELRSYKIVCAKDRSNKYFVKVLESDRNALPGRNHHVIVSECGAVDLSKSISSSDAPLSTKDHKTICRSMTSALAAIHASGLVWTDLKLDNFVMVPPKPFTATTAPPSIFNPETSLAALIASGHSCKAIDLESCVAVGQPMTDISPENLTPEFCSALMGSNGPLSTIGGRGRDIQVGLTEPVLSDPKGDIFALGIAMLHLTLGRNPLTTSASLQEARSKITAAMTSESDFIDALGLAEIMRDGALRRLLGAMLSIDPRKRPSIGDVQRSLYLLF